MLTGIRVLRGFELVHAEAQRHGDFANNDPFSMHGKPENQQAKMRFLRAPSAFMHLCVKKIVPP
jgi:hypothetical protein